MNDTKWREVLLVASRLDLWFLAAFVAEKSPVFSDEFDRKRLCSPLPEVAFERHHIGDWDGKMHGPYKDILWVLYPRRYYSIDYATRKIWHEQNLAAFRDAIAELGKLPVEDTENYVRLYGYK